MRIVVTDRDIIQAAIDKAAEVPLADCCPVAQSFRVGGDGAVTTIRDLDDARDEYKHAKGLEKLSRKLVIGSFGLAIAAITMAVTLNQGWGWLIVPAFFMFFTGLMLWLYLLDEGTVKEARRALRDAEAAYERSMGVGGSK